MIKEEQLKNDLNYILYKYSQEDHLSIGTIYYVFKDCFNQFEQSYYDYIERQNEIMQEQLNSDKEEKENDN